MPKYFTMILSIEAYTCHQGLLVLLVYQASEILNSHKIIHHSNLKTFADWPGSYIDDRSSSIFFTIWNANGLQVRSSGIRLSF